MWGFSLQSNDFNYLHSNQTLISLITSDFFIGSCKNFQWYDNTRLAAKHKARHPELFLANPNSFVCPLWQNDMKEGKLLCKLFLHRWRMHPAKWLTVVVATRICLPFEKNCCKIFEPLEDFSRWVRFYFGFLCKFKQNLYESQILHKPQLLNLTQLSCNR